MLLDEQGVPLTWPTLFATVRLRNAGLAFNSIKNKLNELKVLLRWQSVHRRDLESEFRGGKVLSLADVVSIRDFAAMKVRDHESVDVPRKGQVVQFPEAGLAPARSAAKVSKQVHYNRLTTIADFVEFLGQAVNAHRADKTVAAAVDRMAKELRNHRPRGMSAYQQDDPAHLSPPSEVANEFIAVGSEGHAENPFRGGSIQRRNELIFRLFYETGIRRGELLSLRLDCIHTGREPYITVRRTHDDEYDSRDYQPVAKTKERVLPICDELAAKIHLYCMEDRARTPGANRHPYLFVTHRKGKTCGQPLSMSALGSKVFGAMQQVRPEFTGIHPHSFRHHMNYLISKRVDEHNRRARSGDEPAVEPISEGRELDVRAHMNGHRSPKSGEVYNRRHVREVSDKVVREVQRQLMDRAKSSKAESDE